MKALLISLLILLALTASPTKAALIYMTPVQQHVNVGDTLSIDIWVSDFEPDIVSGWDINLLFDSTILRADDLIFALGNFTFDPDFDALYDFTIDPSNINSFMLSFLLDDELAALQTSPLRLFSVNFTALTDGVSLLSFDNDPLFGLNVVGRNGQSLALSAAGACVSVGQGVCRVDVPEPKTFWLFATMLLVLAGRRSYLN